MSQIFIKLTTLFFIITCITGCKTFDQIKERFQLTITSTNSNGIFVNVTNKSKTLFMQVNDPVIEKDIIKIMDFRGYTLKETPEQANFILQVKVSQIGEIDGAYGIIADVKILEKKNNWLQYETKITTITNRTTLTFEKISADIISNFVHTIVDLFKGESKLWI